MEQAKRQTLIVCLPGDNFSNVWVSNWTSLLSHLQSRFNVRVTFGYSNNIYITRNTILDNIFNDHKAGLEIDLALWMDSDNLLDPAQFESMYKALYDNPRVDGVLGWYWLQPNGYQIQPLVSCGGLDDVFNCEPLRPDRMYQEPMLDEVDYGGLGSLLVHWDSMKEVGENAFTPIIIPNSQWGFSGDDIAYFIRAKAMGQTYLVDKNVKLPHLKLRNADFESAQFVTLPDAVKPALAIDGWMRPEELLWLSQKASSMTSITEIGSWKGRSSYALLASCDGVVTCVDHWEGASDLIIGKHTLREEAKLNDIHAEFLANVCKFHNLRSLKMPSLIAATHLSTDADMVFIDGSHDYEDVKADLLAWMPKTRVLLCGHDIDREDVRRALVAVGIPFKHGPGTIWYHYIEQKEITQLA